MAAIVIPFPRRGLSLPALRAEVSWRRSVEQRAEVRAEAAAEAARLARLEREQAEARLLEAAATLREGA